MSLLPKAPVTERRDVLAHSKGLMGDLFMFQPEEADGIPDFFLLCRRYHSDLHILTLLEGKMGRNLVRRDPAVFRISLHGYFGQGGSFSNSPPVGDVLRSNQSPQATVKE